MKGQISLQNRDYANWSPEARDRYALSEESKSHRRMDENSPGQREDVKLGLPHEQIPSGRLPREVVGRVNYAEKTKNKVE